MLTTGYKADNMVVPAQTFHAILQEYHPNHPHRINLPLAHTHPLPLLSLARGGKGGGKGKEGVDRVLLPNPTQVERAKMARFRGILTPRLDLSGDRAMGEVKLDLPVLIKKEGVEFSNKSISSMASVSEQPILTDIETGTSVLILVPFKKEEDVVHMQADSEYSSVKQSKVENYVVFTKQSSVLINPLPVPSRSRIILEKLCLDTASKGSCHYRPENVVKTFSSPRHTKWKQMDEALFSSASLTSPEEGTLSRSGDEEITNNNNGAGSPLYIRRHPISP